MMHLCYSYFPKGSLPFSPSSQDRSWTPSFPPLPQAAEEFGASRASQLDDAHAYSSEYLGVFWVDFI